MKKKKKPQPNWSYRKLLKSTKKKKTAKLELQKIIEDYEGKNSETGATENY